jgi:hypothetical protein
MASRTRSLRAPAETVGKRIRLDRPTADALEMLARDRMAEFQELVDEAFADLLKKHGRPTELGDALRRSLRGPAARRAPRARR